MPDGLESIASDRLSLTISPLGAELQSVRTGDGRELLWSGDPRWWPSRAPLLFPIVGSLNGDSYSLDGRRFVLPRHGFARRSRFTHIAGGRGHALFRLTASDETRAVYPFDFKLDVSFRVEDLRVEIAARLHNCGAAPLPASFGFHPAFRWPLAAAGPREACRILFDQDEPEPIRRLAADGTLSAETLPSPVRGRELPLRDDLFTHDALIFDRLRSRGLVYGAATGPRLRVEFPAMPYLGLWTKPGAPFLCIEPWQGLADPQAYDGDFRAKPGMIEVEPGRSRTFAMSVTVLDAEGGAQG